MPISSSQALAGSALSTNHHHAAIAASHYDCSQIRCSRHLSTVSRYVRRDSLSLLAHRLAWACPSYYERERRDHCRTIISARPGHSHTPKALCFVIPQVRTPIVCPTYRHQPQQVEGLPPVTSVLGRRGSISDCAQWRTWHQIMRKQRMSPPSSSTVSPSYVALHPCN